MGLCAPAVVAANAALEGSTAACGIIRLEGVEAFFFFFFFLENISNPCTSEGGSFVSRMKRQNRVHTPAVIHTIRRGDILL